MTIGILWSSVLKPHILPKTSHLFKASRSRISNLVSDITLSLFVFICMRSGFHSQWVFTTSPSLGSYVRRLTLRKFSRIVFLLMNCHHQTETSRNTSWHICQIRMTRFVFIFASTKAEILGAISGPENRLARLHLTPTEAKSQNYRRRWYQNCRFKRLLSVTKATEDRFSSTRPRDYPTNYIFEAFRLLHSKRSATTDDGTL